MANRTIHSDVYVNFGKYKGKPVSEVLRADAGYFLWLFEAGQADLAPDVAEAVDAWARRNPKEAERTIASARNSRKIPKTVTPSDDEDKSTVSYTPVVATTPKAQPENWGCW